MCDFYSRASSEDERLRIKSTLFNATNTVLATGKSYLVYVTPEFLTKNESLVKKLIADKVSGFFFFRFSFSNLLKGFVPDCC